MFSGKTLLAPYCQSLSFQMSKLEVDLPDASAGHAPASRWHQKAGAQTPTSSSLTKPCPEAFCKAAVECAK